MQIYTNGNLPGSWSDAELARNLIDIICSEEVHPRPFCIGGDAAFPYKGAVFGRLRTCLKLNSENVVNTLQSMSAADRAAALALNASLISV